MTNIEINRVPIFVNEIFYFQLPDFKVWQEKIKQIVLVEENKLLNSSPTEECNIKAKRTAWNSHYRYPALNDLSKEIQKYLQILIKKVMIFLLYELKNVGLIGIKKIKTHFHINMEDIFQLFCSLMLKIQMLNFFFIQMTMLF